MRRTVDLAVILAVVALAAWGADWWSGRSRATASLQTSAPSPAASQQAMAPIPDGHLAYRDFDAIRHLAWNLADARLVAGLSDQGYQLWKQGQLQMPDVPESGAGVEFDLDGDGLTERALPLRSKDGSLYLVVASHRGEDWQLRGLAPLKSEEGLSDGLRLKELARELLAPKTGRGE